jgi:hypothetical protein
MSRFRHPRGVLGALLASAALAGLAPATAAANDLGLRAITIPASACQKTSGNLGAGATAKLETGFWSLGAPANASSQLVLNCPLPLSNVPLSSSTSTVNLTSFRIVYRDTDALGKGVGVGVILDKTKLQTNGQFLQTVVCSWDSDANGTGSQGFANSTKTCSHTLEAGAFYHFFIYLYTASPYGYTQAGFGGIAFP